MNNLAQRGSLRWHDPDRFDGCDLSRANGYAAPLADAPMMVIFACGGKRRR
jgi:hypothetical protein